MRSLREIYGTHRRSAKQRGIPFLLTFEQWVKIWQDSGHLEERGGRRGKYVMSRNRDKGSYEVGNVRIVLFEKNRADQVGKNHPQWGKSRSLDVRARISASLRGSKHFNWGKQLSAETKNKKSESMRRYHARRREEQST